MRIRTKVLLSAFTMILLTGLSVILVVRSISKRILEEQMFSHLVTIAEARTELVNSILNEYMQVARLASTGNVFIDLVSETGNREEALAAVNRRIGRILVSYKDISRFRILDSNGFVIASSHPDIGADLSSDPIFTNAVNGKISTGELHFSQFTGNPVFSISAPVITEDEFSGAVVINFNADDAIFSAVEDRTGLGETGEVYLIDENGLMLTPSIFMENAVLNIKVDLETVGGIKEICHFSREEHEPVTVITKNYMGNDVLSIHTHLPYLNCILIAEISIDEAFFPVWELTRSMLFVLAGLLVFSSLFSIMVSSRLSKPIENLHKGVQEIMKGNLDYRIETEANDETGELSRAFGDMTSELKESRAVLHEYTENLERKVSERTIELKQQFERSEQQRIATLNILQDLDEAGGKLKEEIEERKRTEEQLRRRTDEIGLLYEAGQQISRSLDLGEICQTVYELVSRKMDCDGMFVSRYDPRTELIQCLYAQVEGESIDPSALPPIPLEPEGRGTQSLVIRSGEPLLINDNLERVRTAEHRYYIDRDQVVTDEEVSEDSEHTNSTLTIPMKLENAVVGVLQVSSYRLNAYSDDDLKLLESLSIQIASASRNAILYETAQKEISDRLEAEKALQQRASQLSALGEIGRNIASMLELNSLLELTVLLVHESFGYSYVSIILVDPLTGMLALRAGAGYDVDSTRDTFLKIGIDGICGHVTATGEYMLVGNVSCEPCYFSMDVLPDTHSELAVPIKVKNGVIGVIDVQSNELNAFDEQDVYILEIIADQTAIAIENTQLFEQAGKDLAEREIAEEALAAEKERLAVTLRSIGDAVITTDITGRIALVNKVAENLTGWSQENSTGRVLTDIFHIIDEKTGEACPNPVDEVLESGNISSHTGYTILINRNSSERLILYSCAPILDADSRTVGTVIVFRDVTQQRKMEEEFLQASRLESIGILAGGLAHDFNNLLTAILGSISVVKMSLSPEDEAYRILTKSENASIRAKNLTQQLLTFSKGGEPIREVISIADLIRETADFSLGGSKSRGEITVSDDIWTVEADAGQISQVFGNLLINADQAMPEGGVIKIVGENIVITDGEIPSLESGRYVLISITDQGIGIPADQMGKIFDPYYTTKQKGSGLGLAIAYSIIKNHDGLISVESEIAIGTVFRVYLPATGSRVHTEAGSEIEEYSGEGRILVMDDDEMVRDVAGEILLNFGYTVDFAENGETAMAMYRKAMDSGNPFDVVIMDLTIPGGMGGKRAMEQLLVIDPHVKGVVSSGYSHDPVMARYSKFGFLGCITKPYRSIELGRVIHEVLNRK